MSEDEIVEERESIRVLMESVDLQRKKSADYQNPNSAVKQADYYPSGIRTIHEIIHGKLLRATSLLESGETPNFESLEDTYKDMINYCSFAVAWMRKGVPGQDPNRDIFNRQEPVKERSRVDPRLVPSGRLAAASDSVKDEVASITRDLYTRGKGLFDGV